MKHCTIIYDSPGEVASLFEAAAAEPDKAAIAFAAECADEMMEAVEKVAHNFGCESDIIRWSGTGTHPVRIGLVCNDVLAETLRSMLRHRYIIELDSPKYRL
jgi:hypothetical protein